MTRYRKLKPKRHHRVKVSYKLRGAGWTDLLNPVVLYKRAKQAIFDGPRQNAPPQIRNWLEQHGNETITKLVVCREPINAAIDYALNIISLGDWNSNKKQLNYDNLYHLWILITTSSGRTWRLEKNEVVQIKQSNDTGQQHMQVSLRDQTIKLRGFIDNGEKIGPSLWVYNPSSANCQMFVMSLLEGCGLMTQELKQFILQDAVATIGKDSLASRLGTSLTDLAARFDILLNGAGYLR